MRGIRRASPGGVWAVCLALACLCACASPTLSPPPAAPAATPTPPRGTIVWGATQLPSNLNPLTADDEVSRWASELVFDGLLRSNEQLGLAGKLATGYEGSPDGLLYTVTINTTAHWHDGEPVTVDDVKFTYDTLLDPATDTVDKTPYDRLARVEIVDGRTLRFVLRQPDAALPAALTIGIVPRHRLAGRDIRDPAFARQPIGNGAYRVDQPAGEAAAACADRLDFVADPAYYFVPVARTERFVWCRLQDEAALEAAIGRGALDAAEVSTEVGRRARADFGWQTFERQGSVRRLVFNADSPAFSDRTIRQALAYAVDRRAVIEAAVGEAGVPALADVPPVAWAYFDSATVNAYPFDPARARAALTADGPRATAATLVYEAGTAELAAVAAVVARNWREVGLTVETVALTGTELDLRVRAGQFNALLRRESSLADPDVSRRYHTDAGKATNVGRFSAPDVDRLLDLGLSTTTVPERTRVYHRLQEKLSVELPALPLYAPVRTVVARPGLTGPRPSPRNPLWNADRWQAP